MLRHGVLCVSFCTGSFVPLNLTYQHCLQHSFFEHLFNLYFIAFPRSAGTLCKHLYVFNDLPTYRGHIGTTI